MNKARKILFENNWLRDFYYIMTVMHRNEMDGKTIHVAITRQWGYNVLRNKLGFLMRKYPKIAEELRTESTWYFDELSQAGSHAYDIVLDRAIKNFEQSEKTETNA